MQNNCTWAPSLDPITTKQEESYKKDLVTQTVTQLKYISQDTKVSKIQNWSCLICIN